MTARLRRTATAALVALIGLCLAWELWLAPLRPGGSLVALKALPLAFALKGILAGRRYTFQWASMLILAYFAEGVTRGWSETGLSRTLAWTEVALALGFFAAAVSYARLTRAGA
jgi:uncharacterized membrane protein